MSKQNTNEVTITTNANGNTETRTESGRFAGMTTTVKGFIIDTTAQSFEEFEIKLPYVRSAEKAAKMAAEKLDVKPPKIVTVSVCENDSIRREYDNGKLVVMAQAIYTDESTAKHYIDTHEDEFNDCVIRKVTLYVLTAQYWAATNDKAAPIYQTDCIRTSTGENMTRLEMREELAKAAEHVLGEKWRVIGMHGARKTSEDGWAIIKLADLEKCRKEPFKLEKCRKDN